MRSRRMIIIIVVLIILALLMLGLGRRNQKRQQAFAEAKQQTLQRCESDGCRQAIHDNFDACISRYYDAYRDNYRSPTAGMLICLQVPTEAYSSFDFADVTAQALNNTNPPVVIRAPSARRVIPFRSRPEREPVIIYNRDNPVDPAQNGEYY